ncbi:MAG: hypothetical protein CMM00_14215 [Rhodopirellula sp.]|nr:hypothetical protein [Rhodopirellula sp.]
MEKRSVREVRAVSHARPSPSRTPERRRCGALILSLCWLRTTR